MGTDVESKRMSPLFSGLESVVTEQVIPPRDKPSRSIPNRTSPRQAPTDLSCPKTCIELPIPLIGKNLQ